jgi:deoxyribodipyrimidine photolyase-related protein
MKHFFTRISKKYPSSIYVSFNELDKLNALLKKGQHQTYIPIDRELQTRLDKYKNIDYLPSPLFLLTENDMEEYLDEDIKDHYFQTNFYRYLRVKFDILMTKGKPTGGKLTYDVKNRKKLPKDIDIPDYLVEEDVDRYISEAKNYIEKLFPDNPGNTDDFWLPITRKGWLKMLEKFVTERLKNFGPYQDAFLIPQLPEELVLFHSSLSPALNIGLLSPLEVIDAALESEEDLYSVEGFVRQILGWREFCRFIYIYKYDEFITSNYLQNYRRITNHWYDGTLNIAPVDDCIQTAFNYGYLHHIQRLMVVGNFMNLVGIHPEDIYRWFYEFSVDSYDWVMLFNTYSMVAYADGREITTKPYISSSNYILKMSNYSAGKWADLWDDLYYNFLDRQVDRLGDNPRMFYMYGHYNKKGEKEIKDIRKKAVAFIDKYTIENYKSI